MRPSVTLHVHFLSVTYNQGTEVYCRDVSCSTIMLEVSQDRLSDTLLYDANKPVPGL